MAAIGRRAPRYRKHKKNPSHILARLMSDALAHYLWPPRWIDAAPA
jgi:hypothetical protein